MAHISSFDFHKILNSKRFTKHKSSTLCVCYLNDSLNTKVLHCAFVIFPFSDYNISLTLQHFMYLYVKLLPVPFCILIVIFYCVNCVSSHELHLNQYM